MNITHSPNCITISTSDFQMRQYPIDRLGTEIGITARQRGLDNSICLHPGQSPFCSGLSPDILRVCRCQQECHNLILSVTRQLQPPFSEQGLFHKMFRSLVSFALSTTTLCQIKLCLIRNSQITRRFVKFDGFQIAVFAMPLLFPRRSEGVRLHCQPAGDCSIPVVLETPARQEELGLLSFLLLPADTIRE